MTTQSALPLIPLLLSLFKDGRPRPSLGRGPLMSNVSRPIDDIDLFKDERDAGDAEGRIEFATFIEGEYIESIMITRARATEIHRDLGELLGMPRKETGNSGELFTHRETATILAALRYWQREGRMSAGHEQDIAADAGPVLSAAEIDSLCEKVTCGLGKTNQSITEERGHEIPR
jgi:hypothetical protein